MILHTTNQLNDSQDAALKMARCIRKYEPSSVGPDVRVEVSEHPVASVNQKRATVFGGPTPVLDILARPDNRRGPWLLNGECFHPSRITKEDLYVG